MQRQAWTFVSILATTVLVAACGGAQAPGAPPAEKAAPAPAKEAPAAAPAKEAPAAPAKEAAGAAVDPAWQKIVDDAKKEGEVLVYGQGFLRGAEGQIVAQEFQKQTGIKVNLVEISGGSGTYQRIREEQRAGVASADVALVTPPFPLVMEKDGVFTVLKDKPLPIFKEPKSVWKADPLAMSEGGAFLINVPNYPIGHVMVNTRLLQAADYPTSYHHLATDPKYKGKIAWVDPKTTGDVPSKWVFWGYSGGGLGLEDIWSIYANQQPMLYPNPAPEADAVSRGEAAIAMGLANFESPADAGAPLKVIRFSGFPAVTNINAIGILKEGKHPNAALVLANWAMTKEGHDFVAKTTKRQSLRTDVPDQLPESIRQPVLTGGDKAGPAYIVSGPQATLNVELYAGLEAMWPRLINGAISKEEFVSSVEGFVKEWEAKNGGPQTKGIPLAD